MKEKLNAEYIASETASDAECAEFLRYNLESVRKIRNRDEWMINGQQFSAHNMRRMAERLAREFMAKSVYPAKEREKMNLLQFRFPRVTQLDIAFSTFDTIPALLKEAKERGFLDGNTAYNRLASKLFFEGGNLDYKEGLPEDFKKDASLYLKAFMRSFAPKHEHKEAITALILSELVKQP